jgi:hypothetical protein
MDIKTKEITYKKSIGRSKKGKLFGVGIFGGLHMVVAFNNGKQEVLGAASHPALARHIAMKNDPEIEFNDLAKSEQVDIWFFNQEIINKYEDLTNQLRSL